MSSETPLLEILGMLPKKFVGFFFVNGLIFYTISPFLNRRLKDSHYIVKLISPIGIGAIVYAAVSIIIFFLISADPIFIISSDHTLTFVKFLDLNFLQLGFFSIMVSFIFASIQ